MLGDSEAVRGELSFWGKDRGQGPSAAGVSSCSEADSEMDAVNFLSSAVFFIIALVSVPWVDPLRACKTANEGAWLYLCTGHMGQPFGKTSLLPSLPVVCG